MISVFSSINGLLLLESVLGKTKKSMNIVTAILTELKFWKVILTKYINIAI